MTSVEARIQPSPTGLCASCDHAQVVPSSKGSTYILCRLSASDPRFLRYPRLPVLACDGYRRKPTAT